MAKKEIIWTSLKLKLLCVIEHIQESKKAAHYCEKYLHTIYLMRLVSRIYKNLTTQ